jgi:hypothetical protein
MNEFNNEMKLNNGLILIDYNRHYFSISDYNSQGFFKKKQENLFGVDLWRSC